MSSENPRQPISLYPVLLINFIGTLGFSLVLPFLVFLVARWGGNALVYGLLASMYPAWQFIGAPVLGRWSDIYGRRKVLLLSQAGTLVSWIVFAIAMLLPEQVLVEVRSTTLGTFALTLPLLVVFFARALDGITGGNISVANAYLTDITPEENRSNNFGKMAISSNLGFIIGPALAGVLGATALGELLPVLAAGLISLIATCLVAFYLPESNPCPYEEPRQCVGVRKVFGQEEKNCFEARGAERIGWREAMRQKGVTYMLGLYFLIFLGFNLFYTSFPNHAARGLDWSVTNTGMFFTVMSSVMVFVQGPVLSRLSKRFEAPFLVVGGGLILATSFIVLSSPQTAIIYLGAVLFAIGNGLMWPSFMALLSRLGDAGSQGMIQGLAASSGSLASIIGLIVGGLAYNAIAEKTFLVSAAIIFLCSSVALRLISPRPPAAEESGSADGSSE